MARAGSWALVDISGFTGNAALQVGNNTGSAVFVVVNGVSLPAAQISITYGLNDIPTASAQIALGRDARTGVDSPVYSQVNSIKQMAEAEIRILGALGDFTSSGTGGVRQQFPFALGTVIFKGYVSGLTYRRSAGRVTMIINFVNQLFDLSASSGGTKDIVPGAPHSFMQSTMEEGPGGVYYTHGATRLSGTLPGELEKDFSKAVMGGLHWVADNSQLQTNDGKFWCNNTGPGNAPIDNREDNTKALNVIEQFGNWEGIATFSNSSYMGPYASACPLLLHSNGYQLAAKVISDQIGMSLASTSLWGMLIGSVLPGFGAGIVPMARGAILAPILPMARQHQATIFPEDYADFNLSAQSQRPLYGVGVLGNYILGTMTDKDPKQCVGASFVAKADDDSPITDGMWLFVNAPPWLEDFTNFDPKAASGDADVVKVLSEVSHDAVGVDDIAVDRDVGAEVPDWTNGMQKYAQMMYATQALRGREGTLVGKLRFDIAPGTTIKISSRGNQLSAGVDTLATDMLGFVARVTIVINAEQASAATTFELTNLRTVEENSTDRFSLNEHPFFGPAYFTYAPIVPELSLPPVV
jgi:hypothetical protein